MEGGDGVGWPTSRPDEYQGWGQGGFHKVVHAYANFDHMNQWGNTHNIV